MECNKDEAIRAKDIAVRKFTEKDLAGAKKFTLKAQSLYPQLEGLTQMLETLEVHIAAANKVNGEMDMYGILGVSPLADDEIIKKQYRKLALHLHPDKNKSIGADGAFQLVSEAFNFLSDKAKRSAYNSRRNIRTAQQRAPSHSGFSAGPAQQRASSHSGFSAGSAQRAPSNSGFSAGPAQQRAPSHSGFSGGPAGFRQFQQTVPTQGGVSGRATDQKVPTKGGVSSASKTSEQTFRTPGGSSTSQQKVTPQSGSSAVPPGVNGHHKHPSKTSRGKPPKSSSQKASSSPQGVFDSKNTFWTVCSRCCMKYEYIRQYLNKTLQCPNCNQAFVAVEIPPPLNLSTNPPQQQQHQNPSSSSGPHISGFNNNSSGGTGARWSPFTGTTYNSTTSSVSGPSQATSVSQVVNEKAKKRKHWEAQTAARWEWSNSSGSILRREDPLKKGREDDSPVRNSGGSLPNQLGTGNRQTGMRFAPGQSQENLEAARANFYRGFSSKLDTQRELSAVELRKMLSEKALVEIREKQKEWKTSRTATKEKEKVKEKLKQKSGLTESQSKKSPLTNSSGDADTEQEAAGMVDMVVPDPDFHVFDSDRSESCFGENQVWAAYDDDDGMPRLYVMIHEVISLNPFKVKMSWLNSKSTSEFGPLDWTGCGFTKSCGEFRVGRHETNTLLNSFSHKVKWMKGSRGIIQIYPQKGDIWALYRNWSPDWNEGTPNEIIHSYDMVEVLDDYHDERGVPIAPLIKAAGFRTVFSKQPDPKEVKRIPKQEMLRFSHQVPSHVLTGDEKPNAPKGFVDLDPAATSPELLQVITPATD